MTSIKGIIDREGRTLLANRLYSLDFARFTRTLILEDSLISGIIKNTIYSMIKALVLYITATKNA